MRSALLTAGLLTLALPAAHALPTAAQIRTAFAALDTTDNAAISATEWDAASFALFRAADKNNNNFIDAAELQGSLIAQDTFLRADTDRDGRLNVSEFMEPRRVPQLHRIRALPRHGTGGLARPKPKRPD